MKIRNDSVRKNDTAIMPMSEKENKDIYDDTMKKKENFMRFFLISIILKSDHWSLHNALISKSGQNAEKSGICFFFKQFSGLAI